MKTVVTLTIVLGLFLLHSFEELSQALNTDNQSFFRRLLSVNNLYMLENLMAFPMDYINFSMKIFFHMMNSYPTHQVGIVLQLNVFFHGKIAHFALQKLRIESIENHATDKGVFP